MEIRAGWNSEYGRTKFDITLDEGDLLALLLEFAGAPLRQSQVDALLGSLTVAQKFALLNTETQRFAVREAARHGLPVPDGEAARIEAERERWGIAVRQMLGLRDDPADADI